jgi:hypothetical protein
MSKDVEFEQRKKMFEQIKNFNRTEQEELYRILRRNNEEMSENRNGIFFDLMTVKQATVDKIQEWIEFCEKNRATFETREKEMSDLLSESLAMNDTADEA